MLNNTEIIIVNEVVKALDPTCSIEVTKDSITIVESTEGIENTIFTDKIVCVEELNECLRLEDKTISIVELQSKLLNIKYNTLKNDILELTNNGTWNTYLTDIKRLSYFVNSWVCDGYSLNNRSIKEYKDIIENCETYEELQETLVNIYDMKQLEGVKNNDYVISTIAEVEADKQFFKEECNKYSELYDREVEEHLNSFKKLNRKFMYIA